MRYKKILLFAVIIFMVGGAFSQQKPAGIISGMIKDAQTKSPITEAVITVSSDAFKGQRFALTDSSGKYKINNLPAGNYSVSFEMEGYEKFVRDTITLKNGMSVDITYHLMKEGKKRNKNHFTINN